VDLLYTWTYNPGADNETTPAVEQAIGGNALVMRAGELTAHNNNETYNSQVYSRTGYGCSEDGRTLYIMVIDKSTDAVYGTSAGCSTSIMCQLARYLGCYNMANFDAGGSAEMMVNNAIVNKTTEGSPRAVANGWMVYSIAPEDDHTPARLEFYDYSLEQPIYASASPAVIAYDKYGAVISYDYQDVTFSCDEAIGSCEGNVFTAGSQAATGMLTATCGDVSVTKQMNVVGASVNLRSQSILIDHVREYPLEVQAKNAGKTYTYDPANLSWVVDDESVATIDANGVLRGVAEGSTQISGTIGEFTDQATVTVQIPTAAVMPLGEMSEWSVKGSSGITAGEIAADGATSFEYGTPRSPHLEYSLAKAFYALPNDVSVKFNSPIPVGTISLTMKAANGTTDTQIKLSPDAGYEAGKDYTLSFNLASALDINDIAIYPLAFKRIRFTMNGSSDYKGTHTFTFGGVSGHYSDFVAVKSIDAQQSTSRVALGPNPAYPGQQLNISASGSVAIYNLAGGLVWSGDAATLAAPAQRGLYIVKTAIGAAKLIVK
jgi:hypothetical protein